MDRDGDRDRDRDGQTKDDGWKETDRIFSANISIDKWSLQSSFYKSFSVAMFEKKLKKSCKQFFFYK